MSSAFGVRLNCPAYSNRSTMTRFVWGARGCHPQMNPQRAVSRAWGTAWAGIEQTMPATQKDESSRQDDLARCIELDLGTLRPNESRLSCGAKLECSQIEFYNTAGRTFTGPIEEGRRQLQAHVRLPTTSQSSGPFPSGSTG